jgi:hypothetical protein
MDRELEIAGAASLGGWLRWKQELHTLPPGAPCPNCATPLKGPYCYACGQLGEKFDRSLLPLIWEAFESFFHADGRLLHTLPRLVLKPAALTRDYIEGRRAAQVPPLRMFLVVMLIFFFVGGLGGSENFKFGTPEDFQGGVQIGQAIKDPDLARALQSRPDLAREIRQGRTRMDVSRQSAIGAWVVPRVKYAAAHPREFTLVFESWTHRIAIAMLPVAAAILSLLFAFNRRFYVFDHLIFTMHSLSFMGLLASVVTLVGIVPVVGDFGTLLYLAAPVHLFVHMRGVYGTGIFGTLWRMAVIFLLSAVAFGMMMAGVLLIGLTEMKGVSEPGPPASAHAAAAPATPKDLNFTVD